MKKLILLFSLIFFAKISWTQRDLLPGYIIKNSGDTVYGQIDYRGEVYNCERCSFKADSADKVVDYLPGQIRSYRITNNRFYVSRQVNISNEKKTVFLEFLVNGIAKLYYLAPDKFFIEKDSSGLQILSNEEHIVKPSAYTYLIPDNRYIGILKINFSDCPQIQNEINTTKLSQRSLIRLTKDYQKYMCPNQECIVYSKNPPKTFVRIGISFTANNNMIDIYPLSLNTDKRDWSWGTMAGFQFEFINKGSFERVFLSIGVFYTERNHDLIYVTPGYFRPREIKFLSKDVYVNSSFNYIYPRYKIKPFVGLGMAYFLTLSGSKNYSPYVTYNPALRSLGPEGNIGTIITLSKKINFKLYGSYHYGLFTYSEDGAYPAKINNVNLGASLLFDLRH